MSEANPLWGAPRIHGELLKLGITVSQATVAKYIVRHRRPPSQTWRTFLANHVTQLMAADFFVVPTITYRLLFVLVIRAISTDILHFRARVLGIQPRQGQRWEPRRRDPLLRALASRGPRVRLVGQAVSSRWSCDRIE
jgi:hypothetical protein